MDCPYIKRPPMPPEPNKISELVERFQSLKSLIGIIGLGYVGLPLLRAAARKGFSALGFDIDRERVHIINTGGSFIQHIAAESINSLRKVGRLAATDDFSRLAECDAIIVCVPTPLT